MSAVALSPALPHDYDPVLDKSYAKTALGPDVVAWLDWLELGGAAERTLDQYERDLSVLCKLYPSKGLQDLTDLELGAAVKKFPPPSRRVRAAAFASFYKWALKTRRIDRNPMDLLPVIKRRPQSYIDVFSDEEVEDLAALSVKDSALMLILVDAGLRKSEARNLQVRRIKLFVLSEGASSEGIAGPQRGVTRTPGSYQGPSTSRAPSESTGELIVIGGKGGKDRVIPLTLRLASSLETLLLFERMGPQDYLWYTRPGGGRVQRSRAIGEGSFDRWWRRCLEEAGVRYRNPHVARHTFATRWLRRGGRLETLSVVMGHTSIRTTFDLYGHLDMTDVAADMALMEAE